MNTRADANLRQAEVLASSIVFVFIVFFFLNGDSKTLLNTYRENLTMDIASVIIVLWQ